MKRLLFGLMLALGLPIGLAADTLIMRDGLRVQGELIAVREGVIDFEERRGFGRGRTRRVERADVARIEFEASSIDAPSSGGRPSGMRERQVTVSATRPSTDTGISVRAGETVYFEATGNVRWGPNRRDGPAGERNSPSNPARPIPNRPATALIGKVGDGSDVFFIGDETGPIRMRSSGRLSLGINDDGLQDNSGNFRVVVYY